MKANLTQTEPNMLRHWDRINLYQKIRDARAGKPLYILHDGPPYANGHIHMGTAINKILKDIIIRSKTMSGYDAPYLPGWDCHGLPIEIKVDQNLAGKKAQMPIVAFRRECRKYAEKFINIQREEFKRLGVLGEWDRPYETMSYDYEAAIARSFGEFVDKGYVYKSLRSVHWCITCQTALAEAEVEYSDHTSPSIYVKFPVKSDLSFISSDLKDKNVSVLIWTTTPWTLPANLGIAVNPEFEYSAVEVGDEVFIVATELLSQVKEKCGWGETNVLARFKGRLLERRLCRHPFIDRDSLLVLADHVTLEQGTGCVHTAPGHGYDDYVIGQVYGLGVLCPVDAKGVFTSEAGRFAGLQIFKANQPIVDLLKDQHKLLAEESITHAYPHCWRCHNPVIFRATPQWFISVDKLRQTTLAAIRKVTWIPAWGEERIANMVENRLDWCISRQRSWGVPIVAFYCKNCGEILFNKRIVDFVADIFEKEGADAWYARSVQELLPEGTRCEKCGGRDFDKESDILDVWFDSGNSHYAVLGRREDLPWPSDLYAEGQDQYRGWFQSSLLVGVALRGEAPYRSVITHGWTLDAQGRPMSKSLGNVIEPRELLQSVGAEIVRLFFSSIEFVEDIRISDNVLGQMSDAYRKMRNTFRILLGNLYDFNPQKDSVPYEALYEIDRWALAKLQQLIKRVRKAYEDYQFHVVYHSVYSFCIKDMSAFYVDVLKDRLYTFAPSSTGRRSAQTAMYEILDSLVRLLAPILPFTCEAVWSHLTKINSAREELVQTSEFPPYEERFDDAPLLKGWERLIEVREIVNKALEEARQSGTIGSSLEARVFLNGHAELYEFLKHYASELRYIFIVSQVELNKTEDVSAEEGLRVVVEKARGKKCERCWNYSERVGENPDFPTLCERCVQAVDRILQESSP